MSEYPITYSTITWDQLITLTDQSVEQFQSHLIPLKLKGIYLLFHERKLVYIGKSVDVAGRIATHRAEKTKIFDAYMIMPAEYGLDIDLAAYEAELIHHFKPPLNKNLPNGPGWYTPRDLADSFGISERRVWEMIVQYQISDRNGRIHIQDFDRALTGRGENSELPERPEIQITEVVG